MGCFRILVVILVMTIIVPLITAFEVLVAVNTTFLNRDFYVSIVDNPDLFDAIFDEVGADTSNLQRLVDAELQSRGISADIRMDDVLADLIDREHWRAQAGSLVDQFFSVMEGRIDAMSLTLNMGSVGEALRGEHGEVIYTAFVRNLSPCGSGESPFNIISLNEQAFPLPLCRPANQTPEQFIAQTDFNAFAAGFPDRHTVVLPVNVNLADRANFGELFSLRGALYTAMLISGVMLFGIWFGSAFIVSSSRRGRFVWLGVTLLFASIGVLAFAALLSSEVLTGLRSDMLRDPSLDAAGVRITQATFGVLDNISLAFWLAGGIPSVIGIMLILIGATQPRYTDSDPYDPYDPYRATVTVGKSKPRRRDGIDDDPWDSPISSS